MRPGLWHRVGLLVGAGVLVGCGAAEGDTTARERASRASEPVTAAPYRPTQATERPGGVNPKPAPIPAPSDTAAGLEPVKRFRSVRGHEEAPLPSGVRIPAIGVDSTLVTLGREPDGTVEVPADWQRPGWFSEGARPGQPGPAVILGHVDSRAGPAVFYRLHELGPGDEIVVDRAGGSIVAFTVDRVERHDKDDFPTRAVYYPTLEPTLRLVTCGGVLDTQARSYQDNVIVFATQAH